MVLEADGRKRLGERARPARTACRRRRRNAVVKSSLNETMLAKHSFTILPITDRLHVAMPARAIPIPIQRRIIAKLIWIKAVTVALN